MQEFVSAAALLERGASVVDVMVAWVLDASEPHASAVFGGRSNAAEVLARWVTRRSSEISAFRAEVLVVNGRVVGGYIAIPGPQVRACRMADLVAMADMRDSQANDTLRRYRATLDGTFSPPPDDDYYLSRIGVVASARRQGYGELLMRRYIQTGTAWGFRRFRLDVSEVNLAARNLYRLFGFNTDRRHENAALGIAYLSQTMVRSPSCLNQLERCSDPRTSSTG